MNLNLLISQFIPQCLQFAQKSRLWAHKSSTDNSIIPCLYLPDHSVILLPIMGEKPRRPIAVCLPIARRCLPKSNTDDLSGGYGAHYSFGRIGKHTRLILNDSWGRIWKSWWNDASRRTWFCRFLPKYKGIRSGATIKLLDSSVVADQRQKNGLRLLWV